MNVSDSLDLLMARLARNNAGLRANLLREMKLFQETDLEGGATLPWFLITENATTVTTVGERRIKLPSDFIREVEEKPLAYVLSGSDDKKLAKQPFDTLMNYFGDEAEGAPQAYALRGNYMMLFPKPDAEYTIQLPGYYARQSAPVDSTSSENAWFKWASDLLIAHAGLKGATLYLKDPDLVQVFASDLAVAKQRLFTAEVAREEANRTREMDDD